MTTAGLGATHGLHSLFSSFFGEFFFKLDHRKKKVSKKKCSLKDSPFHSKAQK
jgi:hypothetical protein